LYQSEGGNEEIEKDYWAELHASANPDLTRI